MKKLLKELEERKDELKILASSSRTPAELIPQAEARLMEVELWIDACKERIKLNT